MNECTALREHWYQCARRREPYTRGSGQRADTRRGGGALCNAASGTRCDCCAREFTAAVLNSMRSSHSKFQHRGSGSRALTLTWRLLWLRDCESASCRVGATGGFSMLQRMTPHPCSYVRAKSTKWGVVGFKTKGAVEVGAGALWRCLGELGARNEGWTWSEHIVYMDEILKI